MTRTVLQTWGRAFRLHHWTKNVLIFVPLFVGHALGDPAKLRQAALGFVFLCILSSATYLINDIVDVDADRLHETKRMRPFVRGDLAISHGWLVASLLTMVALAGAFVVQPRFLVVLAAYLVVTLTYSFSLKRIPLLDVFVIGLLFTLRLVMGAEVAEIGHSRWLLSFSLAFFISLALAKRHSEVMRHSAANLREIAGRGYRGSDWPVTLTFGIGFGLASIIIMLLYMANDAMPSGFYQNDAWLYAIPVLLTIWVMRIWLLSNRMILNDDPVFFALRDGPSILLGLAVALAFYLAL